MKTKTRFLPKKDKMPRVKKTVTIIFSSILLILTSCNYLFDFVIQPFTGDPNSSFEVQIRVVHVIATDTTEGYFGVLLPLGWTINDSAEYQFTNTGEMGVLTHSEPLVQQMASIDPPPDNYHWWVGNTVFVTTEGPDTITANLTIHTDDQTGNFFLDYMLGCETNGLNSQRSNDHLIIIGDPVGCFPEGMTLSTQAEIDSFPINFPECDAIAGNFTINGEDITSVSSLEGLNSVGGNLYIEENNNLISLAGLDSLGSIGGSFSLIKNYELINLSGLENLTSVGRSLTISQNTELESIVGFANLGGDLENLTISDNENLTGLTGMENVTAIEGNLEIRGNIKLESLSGLENITAIGNDLAIYGNTLLSSLMGLANFSSNLRGRLYISNNMALTSLAGLSNIDSVGEGVYILHSWGLSTLSGLNGLTHIGGDLGMYNNSNLSNLTGLEDLVSVGGDLHIGKTVGPPWATYGNPSLVDISALNNLLSIGGALGIKMNDELTSLEGLENINPGSISELRISSNPVLSTCHVQSICDLLSDQDSTLWISGNAPGCNSIEEVLEACDMESCLPEGITFTTQAQIDNFQINYPNCTEIEGDVTIGGNGGSDITNLDGLNVLTVFGGDLRIYNNDSLTSLAGLENITSINGNLAISGNDALPNLSGLENLTSVIGHVGFAGNGALPNLTGLENLSSIGGDFLIASNDTMTSLTGLDNLMSVGGNVTLGNYWHMEQWWGPSGNPLLNDISSLSNLASVTGDLRVCCNISLTNLTGLHNISSVGGDLIIAANDSLIDLLQLSNLDTIAGNLEIGLTLSGAENDPVFYLGNSSLTDLSGLDNLDFIGNSLNISGNDSLENLSGLGSLDFLGGDLSFINNALTSLTGLDNLDSIGGNLGIVQNDSLTNLSGLDNVTSIGGNLTIGTFFYYTNSTGNLSLQSFTGLDALTSIGGYLTIDNNPVLDNILSLNNLDASSITSLTISNNSSLSSCEAQSICDFLSSPGGAVIIYSNAPGCNTPGEIAIECGFAMPCLPYGHYIFTSQADVDNFQDHYPGCTELEGHVRISGDDITNINGLSVINSIGGGLSVSNNTGLTSLTGLEDLSSVGGLSIRYNDGLPNLTGFDGLTSIGGSLSIRYNTGLTSLIGLEALTSIGSGLSISYNDELTSLTGIDNIDAYSINDLYIKYNTSLTTCEVQSICDYLAIPFGEVSIGSNATGCNSQEEIEDACELVSVKESVWQERFTISPNPCSGAAHLRILNKEQGMMILEVFTISGMKILEVMNKELLPGTHDVEVDLRELPAGVYYLVMTTNNGNHSEKLIKL